MAMNSTVHTILKRKGHRVLTVKPQQTMSSVADLLTAHRIGAVPVVDDLGRVIGMISERDLVRGISLHGAAIAQVPVASLMSANITVCQPSDTIDALMAVMTDRRIRHLPVIADNQLCGMISIGDLVKQRIEDAEGEVDALRTYIAS